VKCFSQNTICKVIRVVDGDTFEIINNGKKQTCRLENIDAPELKQNFGTNSRDSLQQLILGKELQINIITTDIYGRNVVKAVINNQSIDKIMVQNGWAWHYTLYSNNLELEIDMNNAITNRKGLWACGKEAVCPPWYYRKYNKINKRIYCDKCNF
jgi:endonuclease YncB( thermonuclease family)